MFLFLVKHSFHEADGVVGAKQVWSVADSFLHNLSAGCKEENRDSD